MRYVEINESVKALDRNFREISLLLYARIIREDCEKINKENEKNLSTILEGNIREMMLMDTYENFLMNTFEFTKKVYDNSNLKSFGYHIINIYIR